MAKQHKWGKTQIKALKSSILHWERMESGKRRVVRGYKRLLESPAPRDCACCRNYNHPKIDSYIDCVRCPIYLYSTHRYCDNTPYVQADMHFAVYGANSPQFKAAAQKQINFMNKVLKAGIPVNKED